MATVYTKHGCPYCERAIIILDKIGCQVQQIDVSVSQDPVAREIVARGMTVPQIFLGQEYIGGCDALEVYVREMIEQGY